jgi:hypothetical protein
VRIHRLAALALLLSVPAAGTARARASSAPAGGAAAVPRVRIEVKAIGRAELDTICPILEGRLLSRKSDEGVRFVSAQEPAEYRLLLEIADMTYTYSQDYERATDAESDPNHPKRTTTVGSELSLDLTLSPAGPGESLYEDSLTFSARRPVEPPEERVSGLLLDDLMNRVTEKIPKIVRKRLRN